MDFRIKCECGKHVVVTTGSAGGSVQCACGRIVIVPSLTELRRQAGISPYKVNPAQVIEQMLKEGELPPVQPCARCGNPTDEVLDAVAECESSWAGGQSVRPDVVDPEVALGIAVGFVEVEELVEVEEDEAKGGNLIVPVPIRMCRGCQRRLLQVWLVPVFRTAELGAALAGWALLFAWSAWAGLLLPAAGVLWLMERRARRRRQSAIQGVLRQVPVYGELFDRYTDAEVFQAGR